jgi:outer membrane receptor protein involved in Fe transport
VAADGTALQGVVLRLRSRNQPVKQVITDTEGNYRITLLPVANDYMLHVAHPGFAPMEVGPLDLDAGRTVVQNVTLRGGDEITETILVESQGSIVDTESARTSTSYNAEFIEGLPIIGHNYQDILTLAPGVTDTDGDGNPNVHGARDTGLQYRLDGGNVTDPVYGTFGQNLNAEMIEEIEIITSGASAEYGRADGGFANIITKSGGNDFQGSFKVYWRAKFLDGEGANNNDLNRHDLRFPDYRDVRPTLSLGGAILKDRLWYFGTFEVLDTQTPRDLLGSNVLLTSRGNYSFGKLTWQANSSHKLTFQVTSDPLTVKGLGLRPGVAPESDYIHKQGGITPQLKWTATLSPHLLLEAVLTSFNRRTQREPLSPRFRPTEVERVVIWHTVQARYPCVVDNCNPARGEKDIYQIDEFTNQVNGPYHLEFDQRGDRNALKTDLSYTLEGERGQHSIKSGFEVQDERFDDEPTVNPILRDRTRRYDPLSAGGPSSAADWVSGEQILVTYTPLTTPQHAASLNSGAYLLDAWKPRPNLTLHAGVRLDREDIDSSGYTLFNPRDERRIAIRLWRAICAAADSVDRATDEFGLVTSQNCYQYNPATFDGKPPQFGYLLPLGHPSSPVTDPDVRRLDLNGDGALESTGDEGAAIMATFTSFFERQTTNFSIVNTNLSPRLALSWDPFADGRTKVFGTWGRYYDRLFLRTIAQEIGPDRVNYTFFPDAITHRISRGAYSLAASTTSITQTDRGLRTPRTDELTLGLERELAPEWSLGITYVRRNGVDLLQDTDLNHITCVQHSLLGIDPFTICGDGARLERDWFGEFGGGRVAPTVGGDFSFNAPFGIGRKVPNGAPDLYTVSPAFNEVLRVENANSSRYDAWEVKLVKRLHRGWQMQASYTWSNAFGQAETFLTPLGNDPETKDDEEGHLSYDQRHVVKLQFVARLPREMSLGTALQWNSGTPWSVIRSLSEFDSTGNTVVRTFYPSGQRNDQRNEGAWDIDGRLEKRFTIGRVEAAAFLNIDNLLNSDYLTILSYNELARDGIALNAYRDLGRRFELGAAFKF